MAARKKRKQATRPAAGKSYSDGTRAEGLRMAAAGVPIREIAEKLGTSLQTPRNWINAELKAGRAVGEFSPGRRRRRRRGGGGARAAGRRAAAAPAAEPAAASGSALSGRDQRLLDDIKAALREYIASAGL